MLLISVPTAKQASAAEEWEFVVAPYLLAPNITGDTGVTPSILAA
jgi:hypothetical protein